MANKRIKLEERMSDEQKIINKISNYISDNRKIIFICLIALVVVLLAILIIGIVSSSAKEKTMIRVSEYERQLEEVVSSGEGTEELISKLEKETNGKSYSAQKAQYLIGLIHAKTNNDAQAYDAFIKSYEKNEKIYLANLALLNAAVCKDNAGEYDEALELYNRIASSKDTLGIIPEALFSMGRIYFQDGRKELSKSTFEQLISSYPNSEYSKIAKNLVNVM